MTDEELERWHEEELAEEIRMGYRDEKGNALVCFL